MFDLDREVQTRQKSFTRVCWSVHTCTIVEWQRRPYDDGTGLFPGM